MSNPIIIDLDVEIDDPKIDLRPAAPIIVKNTPYEGEYTVTPSEQAQTLETNGKSMSDDVTVEAIPSDYVGSTVPRKTAQTYTPTTSDQTIPSGQYLTGVQTLKGDSALVAENIKKDAEIFGVRGSFEGGITPTGTIDISENGDFDVSTFATAQVAVPWNWIGEDCEQIAAYDLGTVKLSDTLFATWTPSATSFQIKPTVTIDTPTLDTENYDYVLRWIVDVSIEYQEGTEPKAAMQRLCMEFAQSIYRKPYGMPQLLDSDYNYNYCTTLLTVALMDYINSNGTRTLWWNGTYGIYPSATAATFTPNPSTTPKVSIKTPAYNARCNNSYLSVASANAIDQDKSVIKGSGYLYRTKKGGAMRSAYEDIVNMYHS